MTAKSPYFAIDEQASWGKMLVLDIDPQHREEIKAALDSYVKAKGLGTVYTVNYGNWRGQVKIDVSARFGLFRVAQEIMKLEKWLPLELREPQPAPQPVPQPEPEEKKKQASPSPSPRRHVRRVKKEWVPTVRKGTRVIPHYPPNGHPHGKVTLEPIVLPIAEVYDYDFVNEKYVLRGVESGDVFSRRYTEKEFSVMIDNITHTVKKPAPPPTPAPAPTPRPVTPHPKRREFHTLGPTYRLKGEK